MKRTTQDLPLEEFDDEKRLWWKVDDIDGNLYRQHYKPTKFNTHMKILSTEQYIPPFLKKFCENANEEHHDREYVQDKPIIERPVSSVPKRNRTKTNDEKSAGSPTPHSSNDLNDNDDIENLKKRYDETIEKLNEKLNEKQTEIENMKKHDSELQEELKRKDDELENLKKQHDETIGKLNEKLTEQEYQNNGKLHEEALKRKDNELENLKKQLELANNRVKLLLSTSKEAFKSHAEALKTKENEIESWKKKYEEVVEKEAEISHRLEEIKDMFFKQITTKVDLSIDEKQSVKDCLEFINMNAVSESTPKTRNKAIKKVTRKIRNLETNAKYIYFNKCKCKKFYK